MRDMFIRGSLLLLLALGGVRVAAAQEGSTIPDNLRGSVQAVFRGEMDGNLIETNYRNHGELARWNDPPHGVYPKEIGGRHMDGIAVVVAGLVRGERAKWSLPPYSFWPEGTPDTLLNPVTLNYRGNNTAAVGGGTWGWLPLPGFLNTVRRNPTTKARESVPAISTDPTSWPEYWPDRLQEEDPGWRNDESDNDPRRAAWNGMFGKGVFNADQESYYVMDDYSEKTYNIDSLTNRPFSNFGVFYPDAADSSRGGLGLQVGVRILQWANILAEDTMFLIYRITNRGQTNYGECLDLGYTIDTLPANAPEPSRGITGAPECGFDRVKSGLYFTQFVDFGLGQEEGDESAAFDPQLDIAYGWDHDGIGNRPTGGTYPLAYVGFAFLESPTNDDDDIDNDRDGLVDEQRFGGPGILVTGQEAIRAQLMATPGFDATLFARYNGRPGASFEEALADRPAYKRGIWWTGDENLDWIGFDDLNQNGQIDIGELVNDDYGRDGIGPYDPGYVEPDEGEGDGIPTAREPNFDETDVDESDQIGLTGFHLSQRPYYESGSNLRDDTWMWARIQESQFPVDTEPVDQIVADVEPFLNFSSGPVNLGANKTDFFSTAWIMGEDEDDFFKNRQTVQNIYNADYRFAQPPIVPTLKGEAGDGYVVLSWDTLSLNSYDRFTQCQDFEGFKLYKGTDPLLSDAKLVTNVDGVAQFYKPIARWDLRNGIKGRVPVLDNTAFYDLGNDTGLQFSYIDRDVTNGRTYYYALVAYDHSTMACNVADDEEAVAIDPQENTFNVRGGTLNVAVVTPQTRPAGYIEASANEDLSHPKAGIGTGSIDVTVVNSSELNSDAVYRLTFSDSTRTGLDLYTTTHYELRNMTDNEVLIGRTPLAPEGETTTSAIDGFVIDINNQAAALNNQRTGWKGVNADGDSTFSFDPRRLTGYTTNWVPLMRPDTTSFFFDSPFEYEVIFANETVYTSPARRFQGFLRNQPLPFRCYNKTQQKPCDIFVYDQNNNDQLDLIGDTFTLADTTLGGAQYRFRYQVRFVSFGPSVQPAQGNVLHIGTSRPFSRNDYFEFTMRQSRVEADSAKSQLDLIKVVPNPYVAAAEWELRPIRGEGRGERMIQFTHLPAQCTVKIYTIRGELVKTINHPEEGSSPGAASWNLLSDDSQEIAYGLYIYHVSAPGIGEKTGKFAIVK